VPRFNGEYTVLCPGPEFLKMVCDAALDFVTRAHRRLTFAPDAASQSTPQIAANHFVLAWCGFLSSKRRPPPGIQECKIRTEPRHEPEKVPAT